MLLLLIIVSLGAGITRREWWHPLLYAILSLFAIIFQVNIANEWRQEAGLSSFDISQVIIDSALINLVLIFLLYGLGLLISRYFLTKTYWPEKLASPNQD